MQLYVPIEQLQWIDRNRQNKSQQTFILQIIGEAMKQENLTTEKLTEERHGSTENRD